jgi:hypothetical protein
MKNRNIILRQEAKNHEEKHQEYAMGKKTTG